MHLDIRKGGDPGVHFRCTFTKNVQIYIKYWYQKCFYLQKGREQAQDPPPQYAHDGTSAHYMEAMLFV